MRFFSLTVALALIALPAAAQTANTIEHQLAIAARQLAAIWRPLPAGPMTRARFTAACQGALEEMQALERRLPEQMDADALAEIRAAQGLIIVPTDENPTVLFVFPDNLMLRGLASGLASFRLDPSGPGRLVLRDAAGNNSNVELGNAGGQTLMRIRPRGSSDVQVFVGCASTIR